MSALEQMVDKNEHIIWKGSPDKKCFILESVFNPLLPFSLIWLSFDVFVIGKAISSDDSSTKYLLIIFMFVHLMPVWIYLSGIVGSVRKYRNTQYIITDRALYVSKGLFSVTNTVKSFAELSTIEIHRGVIDQKLGLGDVIVSTSSFNTSSNSSNKLILKDLNDYQRVYNLIKQLQTDIYSDTMYPNDFRPTTNHGYRTEYANDHK